MRSCRRLVAVVASCSVAAALPAGFATYFQSACPPGWTAVNNSEGRLVVSVTNASFVGGIVGSPLGDQEDRQHSHALSGTFSLPSKHISGDSCCDTQGAGNGDFPEEGSASAAVSGMGFTQLSLCALNNDDGTLSRVPYGAVGLFSPSVTECPANWAPYADGEGRAIVPGYIPTGGTPVTSVDLPLAPLEDRTHAHAFSAQVSVPDVSYVGIDGCCNNAPAPAGSYTAEGEAAAASSGLPYIQLLTCYNTAAGDSAALPPDGLLISPLLGCPLGWQLAATVSGRFLVGLPTGAEPGLAFGGDSLVPNATHAPGSTHPFSGSVNLTHDSVGLAGGCCAGGYAGAASVPFAGTTAPASAGFPFIMVAVCQAVTASGRS